MRKGQAAFDFLSNYMWSMLILVVLLGWLSYFAISNYQDWIPDRCSFPSIINCKEVQITQDEVAKFTFRNAVGSEADFKFNATYISRGSIFATTNCTSLSAVPINSLREVRCPFLGVSFPLEDKVKFEMQVFYKKSGANLWLEAKGELYGTVR